ncbi:hypothetical protein [Bradyrhizobium liaoningense]|uniref:hypothetical protein n=1 Tax=Bradyrhizobium liaoningense TaxID=43992 RepID=UPI001BA7DB1C|nr:hypothetical protein [Bradyrhizobium liaoningense]MBR0855764.1 hypothetical protein [Bradyrhizobium liaoningense]
MMHMPRAFRLSLAALGLLMALSGTARCDDPAEASRESIIQGVRDDVRRQIKQRETEQRASKTRSSVRARHLSKADKSQQANRSKE